MILHKLKYRFSEPYRIRIGVGLSPVRGKREMKALIAFCEEQLKEEHIKKYNLAKHDVFKETIRLYKANDTKLYYYICSHTDWYWL